ncbi:MAG: NusA-like transcription termination signal-binding factor [Acidilobaceae archaeon]
MSNEADKITATELRLISVFNELTKCSALRCFIDSESNRIIFLVDKSEYGRAIGKNGRNIKLLSQIFKRPVEIVKYSDNLEEMVSYLFPAEGIEEVSLVDGRDGKSVTIKIRDEYKGKAIGKNGRNIKRARLLLKALFNVTKVSIK